MASLIIDKRYKILKKLGAGAMGVVYKVKDLKNDSIVALKLLSKKKTTSVAIQRFKREFRLLAELHHPHLCEVYDFGTLKDGRSYYTMEYVDGPNIIEFTKKLPYEKIYPLLVQLCRVLEYIHSRGLIHYDVKPGNVLIARGIEQGAESNKKHYAQSPMFSAKLLDFGLAGEQRIKGGILIRGTMPYIAPEVIKGLAIDHRADLFSLGVLLYEIFTQREFPIKDKESFVSFLKQQENIVSELPSKIVFDIPKRLEKLIIRLFEFEPAQRFSRANEVINEINKISGKKFESETEKTIEGYLLSSRFVGRDKEMGLLRSSYDKARQGNGNILLITGDAGIGKSRLLNEFKIFMQLERSYCFTGYASKDTTTPLQPFYDIFSELINFIGEGIDLRWSKELKMSLAVLFKVFPGLTDGHLRRYLPRLVPLEPQAEKLRTLDALTELIRYIASNLRDMVILLEDLHWADALSIQFLEYLSRNLEDRNVLICGTCRKEELANNLVLKRMITNLRNENYFTQFELRPLRFRSLYSFLDSTITSGSNSSTLVRYLMKKTGGNPFFVEEIMRTFLREKGVSIGEKIEIEGLRQISIPRTIENVVSKRIKDLDSVSQKVVKFGAILLKDFNYNLMKHLTGLDNTELSRSLWELKRKQVLIEEDNRYRFYHVTLRDVVSGRLGDKERRDINYQIAKTLEKISRGKLNTVVEDLAYYFINAKDHKKGVLYGLRAAKKSSERYANEQAIRFYKGVLGIMSDRNPKLRFDILSKLAYIERFVDYYDDAIKHYNEALSLKTGSIDKKIIIHRDIGSVYSIKGDYKGALHIYHKAARLLKKMKPGSFKTFFQTYLKIHIGFTYQILGDYKNAHKFDFPTLNFPRSTFKGEKTLGLLSSMYNIAGVIEIQKRGYSMADYDRAISYFNKAYELHKKTKNKVGIVAVLHNLGAAYSAKFEFQKAFNCYKRSIQISEEIGDQYGVVLKLLNLGGNLKERGCYSEALDSFQRALSISKKIGNSLTIGGSFSGLGECFLQLCNYRKSKEYTEKTLKIFDSIDWIERKSHLIKNLGKVYQAVGDYTLALRYYRKALKICKNIGQQRRIAFLYCDIGTVFIKIGEFSKAKKYIRDALEIASAIELKDAKIECYVHLCRVYKMNKNYAIAKDYYKKGTRVAKELGLNGLLLQFFLLGSEIYYNEERYSKGIKVANKAVRLAKVMDAKDLYVEALLMKVENGIKQGVISKVEVFKILEEAKKIAEEIGSPEILWRVYFEYGKYLKNNKEYLEALDYYQKCNGIFRDVISKIKNESYRRSYFNRPDRQAVLAAMDGIEKLLH